VARHRPVCIQCCIEMKPEKNDVLVVDHRMLTSEEPEPEKQLLCEAWSADLWQCPKCGNSIVQGFGQKSLAYTEEGIKQEIEIYKSMGSPVISNYEYRGGG